MVARSLLFTENLLVPDNALPSVTCLRTAESRQLPTHIFVIMFANLVVRSFFLNKAMYHKFYEFGNPPGIILTTHWDTMPILNSKKKRAFIAKLENGCYLDTP